MKCFHVIVEKELINSITARRTGEEKWLNIGFLFESFNFDWLLEHRKMVKNQFPFHI